MTAMPKEKDQKKERADEVGPVRFKFDEAMRRLVKIKPPGKGTNKDYRNANRKRGK